MLLKLDELNYKNIDIDEDLSFNDEIDNRIIKIDNCHVKGFIKLNDIGEININLVCNGEMIIKDSISLEPIPYKFNINIDETLDEIAENYQNVYEKQKNTLDLQSFLWQNIVLEVPISYSVVKDAELKGNGWELIDSDKKKDEIDPRLKKLEDLLKGDD